MRGMTVGVVAALACACGMGMEDGHGVGLDAGAYAALSVQIGAAASAYGAAAGATVDPAACHSAHGSYGAQVDPMVDRMRAMSAGMDEHMRTMGSRASADMGCGVEGMTAELAHHDAVACTSTMPANRGEAARHAAAMAAWTGHQHARAGELCGMMGGRRASCGGWDPDAAPSAAMTCRRAADGTYTLGP